MKHCPYCQREMADSLVVCPHADCGRLVPPGAAASVLKCSEPGVATIPPPPAGGARGLGELVPPPPPPPPPPAAPVPAPPSSGAVRSDVPVASPPPPPPPMAGRHRDVAAPPPPAAAAAAADVPASPISQAGPPLDINRELANLETRVRVRRRRGWLLAAASAVTLLACAACWGLYYANAVLAYAQVADVQLFRVAGDDQRLALVFEPSTPGTIGFGRVDADRRTQLLDRVGDEAVGQRQEYVWRVSGVKTGDVIQVTYLDGWSLRTIDLPVPGAPGIASTVNGVVAGSAGGRSASDVGVVVGQVVSAIDKQPVVGAQIRMLGTRLTAQTDDRGRFHIAGVPPGHRLIAISADGYGQETVERQIERGDAGEMRVALNPGMEKGQIRIVLTWGEEAKDLDAHLEGPLPDGQRFHVYYHQQGDLKSREFVRLDVDDQSEGGPETITVLGVLPGSYRYFVHDYTNRDQPEADSLARSRAEVRVYQGGQTYRFRAGHEVPGNLWDVCTIEVTPDGAVVRKIDAYRGVKVDTLGLYAKRTMADREKWLGDYGGTPESEKAVKEALDWLARHQLADGRWSNRGLGAGGESRCQADEPCRIPGNTHDMAHTGMTLLAFQAGGHFHFNGGPYSDVVRRGLDWMVAHQDADGALVGIHPRRGYSRDHMYEHGIATFALADACAAAAANGEPEDKRYTAALKRAVDFIEQGQHNDGGWRYSTDRRETSDLSVTGWVVLALKSAKEAGVAVQPAVVSNVKQLFEKRLTDRGRSGYQSAQQVVTEATTGVGMLGRQFLFHEGDSTAVHDAASYLADFAEQRWGPKGGESPDYYLWYNCTLAMFMRGGEPWQRWNNVVRNKLVGLQQHSGCERGSWDPNDRWGKRGGRIYSTALAALSLQVYYRYTPESEMGGEFEMHGAAPRETGTVVAPEPSPAELPGRSGKAPSDEDKPQDDRRPETNSAEGTQRSA